MRSAIGALAVLLAATVSLAGAQAPPAPATCEENFAVLREYTAALENGRRQAEIALAAARKQIADLEAKVAKPMPPPAGK